MSICFMSLGCRGIITGTVVDGLDRCHSSLYFFLACLSVGLYICLQLLFPSACSLLVFQGTLYVVGHVDGVVICENGCTDTLFQATWVKFLDTALT